MVLPVGSSRTRTSPPATPGPPGGRRRRCPPPTSRRLMSATSSREAPAGRVTVSPVSAERGACGDARLVDEPCRPGGFGAVDLHDHGARAADQLVDGALADDPAAVDDRHRVAGALHLVQQVRRQHHGPPLVGQARDHRPHLVHARRVEAVHRLVQDQQLRVAEQAGRPRRGAGACPSSTRRPCRRRAGSGRLAPATGRSAGRRRRRWPRPAGGGCPARSGAGGTGARRRSRRPGPAPAPLRPGRGARAATSCRRRPGSGRAGYGSAWSCPRRSAPGSRTRTRAGRAVPRRRPPRWPRTAWSGRGSPPPTRRAGARAGRRRGPGQARQRAARRPGWRCGAGGSGGGSRRTH